MQKLPEPDFQMAFLKQLLRRGGIDRRQFRLARRRRLAELRKERAYQRPQLGKLDR